MTNTGPPFFFIGSSPSMAATIVNEQNPFVAGVIVSATQLARRARDFNVGAWIMDSGAFTEVVRHGGYSQPVEV